MNTEIETRYAGADWLLANGKELSPLGRDAADLVGHWQRGIYHLEKAARRCDWSHPYHIVLTFRASCLSTYDDSMLTRLVLLAHRMAIRCELRAVGPECFRLVFHRRKRPGSIFERHPTILQAEVEFRRGCPIPVMEDA